MASCPWRKGLARFGPPLRTYTTSARKEEGNMKPTAPKLIRWAGLSAMAAGIVFVVILLLNPLHVPSSVITDAWAIIEYSRVAMSILRLIGLAGFDGRAESQSRGP